MNKPGMEVPQAPASSSSDVCGEKFGAERGKHEHRESAARSDCSRGPLATETQAAAKIKNGERRCQACVTLAELGLVMSVPRRSRKREPLLEKIRASANPLEKDAVPSCIATELSHSDS